MPRNIENKNAWSRKRYAKDPAMRARIKADCAEWVAEHPEERRSIWWKAALKKYNTTIEWYKDKLAEQDDHCALCLAVEGKRRLSVDHNHECCDYHAKCCGKCLRGLLCVNCNRNLAIIERVLKQGTVVPISGTWLDSILQYLTKYKTQETQKWKQELGTNSLVV